MIICSYQGGNAKPPKESASGNISERMLEFVLLKCPFYEVKFVRELRLRLSVSSQGTSSRKNNRDKMEKNRKEAPGAYSVKRKSRKRDTVP